MPGIAIFAVAIFAAILMGMFKRVKNQASTSGTVVLRECRNEPGDGSKYYAYVEYIVDGQVYVLKSRNKSSTYHTGQKLKVAFNKHNPNESFIKPTFSDYVVVVIMLAVAIIVTMKTI